MKNLSPADFYSVRNALGLSLSTVAKESEINRNYLSNFEKKKHFLDETAKVKLRDYYLSIDPDAFSALESDEEEPDFDPEQPEKKAPVTTPKASAVSLLSEMGYRLVDGRYVVPAATDDELIEDEREKMESIDNELSSLLAESAPVSQGVIFGPSLNRNEAIEKGVKALAMLARKQLHHDAMQGIETLPLVHVEGGSVFDFEDKELSEVTVQDIVSRMLHPDNQLPQPE
jgi:transcriptional regulator with XRE-family HTH domain|tara:strand:+ start:2142 stop:2828 length:687 start_codon:yes stop_codon:yes gene_type:complete